MLPATDSVIFHDDIFHGEIFHDDIFQVQLWSLGQNKTYQNSWSLCVFFLAKFTFETIGGRIFEITQRDSTRIWKCESSGPLCWFTDSAPDYSRVYRNRL